MEMPITQSAPSTASAAPAAGGSAAKAADGQKGFDQTLIQTITSANGSTQGNASQANVKDPAQALAVSPLAALLGQNVSAADLLTVLEQLLSKLDDSGQASEDSDLPDASADQLSDVLDQLDDLMAMLGIAPVFTQPAALQNMLMQSSDQAGEQGSVETLTNEAFSQSAVFSTEAQLQQVLQSAVMIQSANGTDQSADANATAITALKTGLKDALSELKAFIQDNKKAGTTAAGRSQLGAISKTLESVSQLLNAQSVSDQSQDAGFTVDPSVRNAVQSLQASAAANTHLNRMGDQLIHSGILSAVSLKEESQSENDTTSALTAIIPTAGANIEMLKQASSTKAPVEQPVQVQQFAQTMHGLIVKQFNVSNSGGMHEARITLLPEQLGQVDVRISVHNGQLTALFTTDTANAKDLLENQMAQLRQALQTQGLQVDKLEVSQNSVQPDLFQERQGQQNREQQTDKRNKSKNGALSEISNFDADLEQMSVEQAVDRDLGLGRGIHTTA